MSPPRPLDSAFEKRPEPPARFKLSLTSNEILPARPAPELDTDILPPSAIVSVGVETVMLPALPHAPLCKHACLEEAVLNKPLGCSTLNLPDMETESLAVTFISPPSPEACSTLLLEIRAPPVRVNLSTPTEMSPPRL